MLMYLFFFFQAEDGIRDKVVTGVQTCALPICQCGMRNAECGIDGPDSASDTPAGAVLPPSEWSARARCDPRGGAHLRATDDRIGAGRLEDPHVGAVCRPIAVRRFRIPLDLRRRL